MANDQWLPTDMTYDPEVQEIDLWCLGFRVTGILAAAREARDMMSREPAAIPVARLTADIASLHRWLGCLGIVALEGDDDGTD